MFVTFNLNLDDFDFFLKSNMAKKDYWFKIGVGVLDDQKEKIENFSEFLSDTLLHGTKLQENYFSSNIKADIFLSHSHKDRNLALTLAGWLKIEKSLSTFIDSSIWGSHNELKKAIDKIYSKMPNTATSYYYDKSNFVSTNIDIMLSNALSKMMDNCETVIFLNTNESIAQLPKNFNQDFTYSPWIYHELTNTQLLRRTIPKRIENKIKNKLVKQGESKLDESVKDLNFVYEVTNLIDKMVELNLDDLIQWSDNPSKKLESLDYLYDNKKIIKLNNKLLY